MFNFLLDKLKTDREQYCAIKSQLFYELQKQGKKVDETDILKYDFFCHNTRGNIKNAGINKSQIPTTNEK
jgi:hypothetical protein